MVHYSPINNSNLLTKAVVLLGMHRFDLVLLRRACHGGRRNDVLSQAAITAQEEDRYTIAQKDRLRISDWVTDIF